MKRLTLKLWIVIFMSSCGVRTVVKNDIGYIGWTVQQLEEEISRKGVLHLTDEVIDLRGDTLQLNGEIKILGNAKITNGAIKGRQGKISAGRVHCFNNIQLSGTWTNDVFNLCWLTNGQRAEDNFLALTNIVRLGKIVFLDTVYEIKSSLSVPSYNGKEKIHIIGEDAKTSGLVLNPGKDRNFAYFSSNGGNNVYLKNITLTTLNEIKGKIPDPESVTFASSIYSSRNPNARPKMDHFTIEGCRILGNIQFSYRTSSNQISEDEFYDLGIRKVSIKNCYLSNVVKVFSLTNGIYDSVFIVNNELRNIYGPVLMLGIAGLPAGFSHMGVKNQRNYMLVKDNVVINDYAVNAVDPEYMAMVVAKGRDFDIVNNRVENILNLNPGSETYSFYCSASGLLKVTGNKILNCGTINNGGAEGVTSLFKLKGTTNALIEDNQLIFDKNGLVQLGLLSDSLADITAIDSSLFRSCLFDYWRIGADSITSLSIINNTMYASVISAATLLFNSTFILRGNSIQIDHIRSPDAKNWGELGALIPYTLFYFRSPVKNGNLLVEDNTVKIHSVDSDQLFFIHNQNENTEFDEVRYVDNIFDMPASLVLSYPRTELLTERNEFRGKGSIVHYQAPTSKRNRTISQIVSTQKIANFVDNPFGLTFIKTFGTTEIHVERNLSNTLTIAPINFNDLYFYNDIDSLPIRFSVELKCIYSERRVINLAYDLIFVSHNRMYFREASTGDLMYRSPYWKEGDEPFTYYVQERKNSFYKIDFTVTADPGWGTRKGVGYIQIRGLEEVPSFTVVTKVEKYRTDKKAGLVKSIRRSLTEE